MAANLNDWRPSYFATLSLIRASCRRDSIEALESHVHDAQSVNTPDARFVASSNVVACDVEGGLALLNIETATYFGLNQVGGVVWTLLASPRSLDELVAEVTDKFDVQAQQCRSDLSSLLAAMVKADLVQQTG